MFSPDIVNSDAFLDMPVSSQVLYFHLGMRADDDGFVTPKMIMRLIGSGDDDLNVLKAKRFILPFESGVIVIKHWLIHNLIRSDLYKETLYKKEKSLLGLNENGAYTELRDGIVELKQVEAPEWLKIRRGQKRTANVPQTVPRLGKVRLGKDRILLGQEAVKPQVDKFTSEGAEVIKAFEVIDAKNKTYYANKTQRTSADFLVKEYGLEKVLKIVSMLPKSNGLDFFPNITSAHDLKEKWVKLAISFQKLKNKEVVIL